MEETRIYGKSGCALQEEEDRNSRRKRQSTQKLKAKSIAGYDGFIYALSGGNSFLRAPRRTIRRWFIKAICLVPMMPVISTARKRYDFILITLVMYNVIKVPVTVALFIGRDQGLANEIFEYIVDLFFILDLFVNFRTEVYIDDFTTIKQPGEIVNTYFRTWFALDLFCAIPYDNIMKSFRNDLHDPNLVIAMMDLPRMLRALRIPRIYTRMERNMLMSPGAIRILRQFLLILLFTHYMGCLLLFVAYVEEHYTEDTSWIEFYMQERGIAYLSPGHRYLYGFYYSLVTVTTVGYGDFNPQTNVEIAMVVCCIILGASIYTFTIGNVTYMLQTVDRSNAVYDRKMDEVRFYLSSKGVPAALKRRVIDYYKFLWNRHRFLEDRDILSDLSESLRSDIIAHQAGDFLHRIPFFQSSTRERLRAFATCLEPLVFAPSDVVLKEGSKARDLYFITYGEVKVVKGEDVEGEGSIVAVLGEGSFFGEIAVMYKEPRTATVIAKGFTDTMVLLEDHCDNYLLADQEMTLRLMVVAQKRVSRMKTWVETAEVDGYVPKLLSNEKLEKVVKKVETMSVASVGSRRNSVVEANAAPAADGDEGDAQNAQGRGRRQSIANAISMRRQSIVRGGLDKSGLSLMQLKRMPGPHPLAQIFQTVAEKSGGDDSSEFVSARVAELKVQWISTADTLVASYPTEGDLMREFPNWPRGFVAGIYQWLHDKERREDVADNFETS